MSVCHRCRQRSRLLDWTCTGLSRPRHRPFDISHHITIFEAIRRRHFARGILQEREPLMDPHELAIAALNQVAAHSSTHRRDLAAGKTASSPNATGVDMPNNATDDDAANGQESSQTLQGTDGMASKGRASHESQNNTIPGVQSASTTNSQTTAEGHALSTPPTSASDGFSSQSTNPEGQMSQLSQLIHLAAAQPPMTHTPAARPNLPIAPTAGQKRTADGQVKPTLSNSPPSPYGYHARGHSRNTSAVSISSTTSTKIGEVNTNKKNIISQTSY